MELGCSTLLFGGFDLDTALREIGEAGYTAIELTAIPGMGDFVPVDREEGFYRDLLAQITDYNLAIESLGASTNLLDENARKRFIRLMEIGHILKAPAITTGSGGVQDDPDSFEQVIKVLQSLTPVAQRTGVKISIKPHVRSAVYNTPTALRMMERVDRQWIGINFDASHLWRANETPEESLEQLRDYIVTARIRDTLSRDIPIGPVETQVPGGGAMNLPAICAGLKRLPKVHWAVLEIVGTKGMPLEEVRSVVVRSYQVLKPYFEN